MDAVWATLDPDTSPLASLFLKLSGPKRVKDARLWDDWQWLDWSAEAEEALQHFNGRTYGDDYYVTVKRDTRMDWMEDALFPRLLSVSATDHPHLRQGDKVMIVAGKGLTWGVN